jgi:hypothetical protein
VIGSVLEKQGWMDRNLIYKNATAFGPCIEPFCTVLSDFLVFCSTYRILSDLKNRAAPVPCSTDTLSFFFFLIFFSPTSSPVTSSVVRIKKNMESNSGDRKVTFEQER